MVPEATSGTSLNVWVQLGNTGAGLSTAGAVIDVYGTTMGVESLITSVDPKAPQARAGGAFKSDAPQLAARFTGRAKMRSNAPCTSSGMSVGEPTPTR